MAVTPWSLHAQAFVLVTLAIQNSSLTLLMRYSRTRVGPIYHASTVVCASELLKILLCLFIESAHHNFRLVEVLRILRADIRKHPSHLLALLIPSALYALQNNLCYVALGHLHVVNYQVLYQMKILTTALFSRAMLDKRITKLQWLALLILVLGVVLVQSSESSITPGKTALSKPSKPGNSTVGVAALMLASVSSGFAGVYFEKLTKSTAATRSLWIQSIELGIFGLFFSVAVAVVDAPRTGVFADGISSLLVGWDVLVVTIIFVQALSGLLVGLVIRYIDNIWKGFATSASIVLSSIIAFGWLGHQPTLLLVLGSALVASAVFLYGLAPRILAAPLHSPLLPRSKASNFMDPIPSQLIYKQNIPKYKSLEDLTTTHRPSSR